MKSEWMLPSLDDALHSLISNLAANWEDEEICPQQKYIYPTDPKDPLEWGSDLAFTIYARWYLGEVDEELANFILQSDETEIISPDLVILLENRKEEKWKEKYESGPSIFHIYEFPHKFLRHRVCHSCLSTDIFEFNESGEIYCYVYDEVKDEWIKGDCEAQPKKQGVLTKEQWQYFVDKGAPEFYLRDITEIAFEANESDMGWTNIFRIYGSHPYEAVMPDSLRDTCFILYDQVRKMILTVEEVEKCRNLGISEEYLLKILEETGHQGAWMNPEVIFELNIEDYMDICDCDVEAATSIFESLAPIREEHKSDTEYSRRQRNHEFETSMIELRHKMGLISLEDATELSDQAKSNSPWKQRKEENKAFKIANASDSITKHTQRACQWASDLGLEKITGAQLSLFFFEEGERPDGDVSKKILKRVNEILNS
jgi:hypothetical protein